MRRAVPLLVLAGLIAIPAHAATQSARSGTVLVTPAQYLASLPHPIFKKGNTLLPLTRWGWALSFDAQIEFSRWGYALDLGEANPTTVKALNDPNSTVSKLIAMVRADPSKYKLSVEFPAILQRGDMPPEAYLHDASGKVIMPVQWSPEAPDSLMSEIATRAAELLSKIAAQAPIAIVLNGGERGLAVPEVVAKWARESPDVSAAKGHSTWYEYVSRQKARQERFLTGAAHRGAPGAVYIYYPTGNQYALSTSQKWDWDYRWMQYVADYPSGSFYYKEFNDGWTADWFGKSDILTQVLNQHGYDTALGHPLAYHWVNDGWSNSPNDPKLGDLGLYTGFLKSTYTSGMIGGIAGYFTYPKGGFDAPFDASSPPHWLKQMEALGWVHAEFSFLEDMLRDGILLPGPGRNVLNPSQPAYEFPTGFANTRVLIRKKRGEQRWLISAWAADGVVRKTSVAVPGFGPADIEATPAATLYDARIVNGRKLLSLLDGGKTEPAALKIPSLKSDAEK